MLFQDIELTIKTFHKHDLVKEAGLWLLKMYEMEHPNFGGFEFRDEIQPDSILDEVVAAVDVPVTLKTRLGFLNGHENILRVAQRAEQAGIAALALHGLS